MSVADPKEYLLSFLRKVGHHLHKDHDYKPANSQHYVALDFKSVIENYKAITVPSIPGAVDTIPRQYKDAEVIGAIAEKLTEILGLTCSVVDLPGKKNWFNKLLIIHGKPSLEMLAKNNVSFLGSMAYNQKPGRSPDEPS